MKSIEEKARLWDYYQDLVKYAGFDSITDLLAENKRLQSVIDEANAQEPEYFVAPNGEVRESAKANDAMEWGARFKPLYARPIPAQQSPAVAVPDVEMLATIIRKVDGNHSLGASALAEKIIGEIRGVAAQSPHITEQDAYKILSSFADIDTWWFSHWLENEEGRALLDKLNEVKQCAG